MASSSSPSLRPAGCQLPSVCCTNWRQVHMEWVLKLCVVSAVARCTGSFSLPFYLPQPQSIKCTVGVALSSPPLFRAVFAPLLQLGISLVPATELSERGRWSRGPRAFGGGEVGISRLVGFNPRSLPGVHRVGNEAKAIGGPRISIVFLFYRGFP